MSMYAEVLDIKPYICDAKYLLNHIEKVGYSKGRLIHDSLVVIEQYMRYNFHPEIDMHPIIVHNDNGYNTRIIPSHYMKELTEQGNKIFSPYDIIRSVSC